MSDKKKSSADDQLPEDMSVEPEEQIETEETVADEDRVEYKAGNVAVPEKNEAEEFKSKYLRAVADYQNLERRMFEERREVETRAKSQLVSRLLPFLDNLDKAEMFIKDPGLKMIKDQFMQTIGELGVKEVPLAGTEFDPHTAEVIEVVEGNEDNTIVDVLRKAYSLNGKVIQHGQVRVSKKNT